MTTFASKYWISVAAIAIAALLLVWLVAARTASTHWGGNARTVAEIAVRRNDAPGQYRLELATTVLEPHLIGWPPPQDVVLCSVQPFGVETQKMRIGILRTWLRVRHDEIRVYHDVISDTESELALALIGSELYDHPGWTLRLVGRPSTFGTVENGMITATNHLVDLKWAIADIAWLAGMLWALPNAMLYERRRRKWSRFRHGQCVHCTYDLAGLPASAPCPECGRISARRAE